MTMRKIHARPNLLELHHPWRAEQMTPAIPWVIQHHRLGEAACAPGHRPRTIFREFELSRIFILEALTRTRYPLRGWLFALKDD
jgi:hypothetical protein